MIYITLNERVIVQYFSSFRCCQFLSGRLVGHLADGDWSLSTVTSRVFVRYGMVCRGGEESYIHGFRVARRAVCSISVY
ncbi:hypothetical protein QTP88_028680 [Uroleucon formosanum]